MSCCSRTSVEYFEEGVRKEAVLEACADEHGEAGEADSLAGKRCVKVKALFCERDDVWE